MTSQEYLCANHKQKEPAAKATSFAHLYAWLWLPEGHEGIAAVVMGRAAAEKAHNYWITTVKPDGSPHAMVVWGLWQDGRFLFSTGTTSRKARNMNCILATEHAQEAVIVEGVAETADVSARRKFLPAYEKKYKFNMSSMKDGILSMKEPVFAVRPRVVFGLWEKYFQSKSTRWKFE